MLQLSVVDWLRYVQIRFPGARMYMIGCLVNECSGLSEFSFLLLPTPTIFYYYIIIIILKL
jgi:hypothetical protein